MTADAMQLEEDLPRMNHSIKESRSVAFAAVVATLAFASLAGYSVFGASHIQKQSTVLSRNMELDADGKKHHVTGHSRSSHRGSSRKKGNHRIHSVGASSPTSVPTSIHTSSRKHGNHGEHSSDAQVPTVEPTIKSNSRKNHRESIASLSPTSEPTRVSRKERRRDDKKSPTLVPTTGVDGSGFRTGLSDGNHSALSEKLWDALHELSASEKLGFGHQYDNYYGQFFHKPEALNQSDVHNSTGDYPLIFGYDLQAMLNGEDYLDHVMWAANRGAIIEFSWLANNPLSNGDDHECMVDDGENLGLNPLNEVLPGGVAHETWLEWLRNLAVFFHKMKLGSGEEYPFLLRLFHENNEDWYWWGSTCSRNHDFKALWEMTWRYLVEEMNVHNALFVFSPSKPSSAHFEGRYPGDQFVDIIAYDRYAVVDTYVEYMKQDCRKIVDFAISHGKIPAIGETGIWEGLSTMTESDKSMWFKTDLLKPVMHHCPRVAYAFTYTNFGHDRYFIPLPGEYTYPGFKAFYNSSESVFLNDEFWYDGDFAVDVRQQVPVQISGPDNINGWRTDHDDETTSFQTGDEDDTYYESQSDDDSSSNTKGGSSKHKSHHKSHHESRKKDNSRTTSSTDDDGAMLSQANEED